MMTSFNKTRRGRRQPRKKRRVKTHRPVFPFGVELAEDLELDILLRGDGEHSVGSVRVQLLHVVAVSWLVGFLFVGCAREST